MRGSGRGSLLAELPAGGLLKVGAGHDAAALHDVDHGQVGELAGGALDVQVPVMAAQEKPCQPAQQPRQRMCPQAIVRQQTIRRYSVTIESSQASLTNRDVECSFSCTTQYHHAHSVGQPDIVIRDSCWVREASRLTRVFSMIPQSYIAGNQSVGTCSSGKAGVIQHGNLP